jgi:hypothetical protein
MGSFRRPIERSSPKKKREAAPKKREKLAANGAVNEEG